VIDIEQENDKAGKEENKGEMEEQGQRVNCQREV